MLHCPKKDVFLPLERDMINKDIHNAPQYLWSIHSEGDGIIDMFLDGIYYKNA